jgi:hypothetical protein
VHIESSGVNSEFKVFIPLYKDIGGFFSCMMVIPLVSDVMLILILIVVDSGTSDCHSRMILVIEINVACHLM